MTPEIELQIQTLLAEGTNLVVKVWGDLYPQGRRYTGPEIIVSDIQPAGVIAQLPTATPTGVSDEPFATAGLEYVNVYSGVGNEHPVVGQMLQGQPCPIIARVENNDWTMVRCSPSPEGWVFNADVILHGDLSRIPTVVIVTPVPPTSVPPTPVPPTPVQPVLRNWQASYYANRNLDGPPVVTKSVPAVDFDWGPGSPAADVPADSFSASYTYALDFLPDTYLLCICDLDDGARLYIDDQLVLDEWREGFSRDVLVRRHLSGQHRIRIEYFESTGAASIRFAFARGSGIQTDWQAVYWNDTALMGSRSESAPASGYALDYNWGTGSPVPGVVNPDLFMARWSTFFNFEAGQYIVNVRSDDGVRIYMDGLLIVDAWNGGYQELSTLVSGVGRGLHLITVDYYENVGDASVQVWWNLDTRMQTE